MASGEDVTTRRLTRRDLVRASIVAGTIAVWSAPVVTRVAAAPPTQGSAPPNGPGRAKRDPSAGVAGPAAPGPAAPVDG